MKLTIGSFEMGYIVITNDAVLSVISKGAVEAGAGIVGGAVGAIVGRELEKRQASKSTGEAAPIASLSALAEIRSGRVADLPREITTSPGWPKVESFRQVTIYPKRAISSVKVSILRGLVVQCGGRSYPMAVQMWQIGKLKAHLSEAKYPLG